MGGMRVDKEELKRKITMPEYLRHAIRDAIESKDAAGNRHFDSAADPSECPLVVFINPNSGGRHGPKLKSRLQELMGEEQVLQSLPHSFSLTIFSRCPCLGARWLIELRMTGPVIEVSNGRAVLARPI